MTGKRGIHGHREQYTIFFPSQISPECVPSPIEENALAPVHPIRCPFGNMERMASEREPLHVFAGTRRLCPARQGIRKPADLRESAGRTEEVASVAESLPSRLEEGVFRCRRQAFRVADRINLIP